MKSSSLPRWIATGLVMSLAFVCGCDGTSDLTFLDLLNTVFLGITAAGGIALIRNL